MAGDFEGSKLTYVNAFQFNPYFSLGFGTGFWTYGGAIGIPVFADFRANFFDSRISPNFSVGIGHAIGDMFFNLNLTPGVTFMVGN